MTKALFRSLAHLVFRGRKFHYRHLRELAGEVRGKRILEIGSGRAVNGEYIYSARKLFDPSNSFLCTDIVPDYGHEVVDVTTMGFEEEFDIVLCLNVVEHVYHFERAFDAVHRATKPGGTAIVAVPGYYPLHDEPFDYWRFTEHSLRRLLAPYRSVQIFHAGIRQYPFAYFARATK